jgi:hypothetical protein
MCIDRVPSSGFPFLDGILTSRRFYTTHLTKIQVPITTVRLGFLHSRTCGNICALWKAIPLEQELEMRTILSRFFSISIRFAEVRVAHQWANCLA